MTKHPSYRARDQPEGGASSQHRKEIVMHKFEKRDAKSRTLVILAVVGLAAALTVGIFTAVRMIRKPAASKDDPKTGIVYDDSAVEGGWDNLSPEEIAEKLNEKVAEGMINISMNTAPYFEDGKAEGNIMIVNESINNYPQQVEFIRNDMRTMAIQLPEELFERLKAYLKKNNLKQKQFIIGLIEDALEQDEEDSNGNSETEEPDEPDMDAEEE